MPDNNSVPRVESSSATAEVPSSNAGIAFAHTQPASSGKLIRSTVIAAVIAALLLLTVVMPAEYGVDPTGIGRVLGLTEMGEIKAQLAKEAAADAAADLAGGLASSAVGGVAPRATTSNVTGANAHQAVPNPVPASLPVQATPNTPVPTAAPQPTAAVAAAKTDEASVTLRPNEGKEIKLAMQKGARVNYTWSTDRGVVNYDTHADRKAAPAIKYFNYAKGQARPSDTGVLVAAFDGMHGWFWRNRTSDVVTVTLKTSGDYTELKLME